MSFGPTPATSAHTRDHALAPRRDRSVESEHRRNPPVPRTKRAAPRANSAGAYARAAFDQRSPGSRPDTPSKASEQRRPRAESPFTYARKSNLTREREAPENQRFEMGPAPKVIDPYPDDHAKQHLLGKGNNGCDGGMPWVDPTTNAERGRANVEPARRQTLQRERQAADQALEWAPKAGRPPLPGGDGTLEPSEKNFARIRTLNREEQESQRHMPTFGTGATQTGGTGGTCHARRNVLARENSVERAGGMPDHFVTPGGDDGSVPIFGRRSLVK